jgi:class 3 adenylate cyclase
LRYSTCLKGHYDRDPELVAILCSDVVGYSGLAGADEDPILARLRAQRSDLIDRTITVHKGRVVDAVRCAIAARRSEGHRPTFTDN